MKILAIGISIFFISFNLFAIDTRLIGTWINENKRPVIVFTEEKGFIYSEIIDDEINEFLGGNYKTPYELYLNDNNIHAGYIGNGGNSHWGIRIDVYFHLLSNDVLLIIVKNYYYADDWNRYYNNEHTFLLKKLK